LRPLARPDEHRALAGGGHRGTGARSRVARGGLAQRRAARQRALSRGARPRRGRDRALGGPAGPPDRRVAPARLRRNAGRLVRARSERPLRPALQRSWADHVRMSWFWAHPTKWGAALLRITDDLPRRAAVASRRGRTRRQEE